MLHTTPTDLTAKYGDTLADVTGIEAKDLGRTIVVTIEGLGETTQQIEFAGCDFARLMAQNEDTADLGVTLLNYSFEAANLVKNGIWT